MNKMLRIEEPPLLFGNKQSLEDPRDGLALFGPYDNTATGLRAGVVGTQDGIRRFKKWVNSIQRPVGVNHAARFRPPFPGFEAVFGIPWKPEPVLEVPIDSAELDRALSLDDRHIRIFKTVDVFTNAVDQARTNEDAKADVWFIVIPDKVHRYCTPLSYAPAMGRIVAEGKMKVGYARSLQSAPSLFPDLDGDPEPYLFDPDFRRQLKARMLRHGIPTQILKESTIAPYDFLDKFGRPIRNLEKRLAEVAWNVSTAAFYKLGARPWKLNGVREGVCYIGLVFKNDDKSTDKSTACCAAQMFLDSGDGVVFKGRVGPWYTGKRGRFHLSREAARELLSKALIDYRQRMKGANPKEIFIHGRTGFTDDMEWQGFQDAVVGVDTNLVGVGIRHTDRFRLYHRDGKDPVLRGLGVALSERSAMLATSGFVPRLQTYYGAEVPVPLSISISRGEANIETVMTDILGLTKLNYNSCRHSDGLPVTLKFADAVGEILVSGPTSKEDPPLQFRYYI